MPERSPANYSNEFTFRGFKANFNKINKERNYVNITHTQRLTWEAPMGTNPDVHSGLPCPCQALRLRVHKLSCSFKTSGLNAN